MLAPIKTVTNFIAKKSSYLYDNRLQIARHTIWLRATRARQIYSINIFEQDNDVQSTSITSARECTRIYICWGEVKEYTKE